MMDFSTRPRVRHSAGDLALVGIGLVVLAAAAWNAVATRAERGRVNAALGEVQADTAAIQSRLRSLGARRVGEGERLATRQELTSDAPPERLLAEVTALLPEGVRLTSASFVYGESVGVELNVEARSAALWDELLDRLAASKVFTAVRPGQEQRDGEIRAAVRMTWSGARS